MKDSIAELKQTIAATKPDTHGDNKAYRDNVTGIILKKCLMGYATGELVSVISIAVCSGTAFASIPALFSSGGLLENSSGGEEEDTELKEGDGAETPSALTQERVEEVQKTWRTVSGIIQSIKDPVTAAQMGEVLFGKLSLNELSMFLRLVEVSISVAERTVASFEVIQKPLNELMSGIASTLETLGSMEAACIQFGQEIDATTRGPFSIQDATEVDTKWNEVAESSEGYLDVVNTQGISPTSWQEI
ncbi:hypothetical protein G7Z17_g10827 [Cylindrodendrum hubeiense]|uniref:Uncharacterized protein n=1 Tax=Cylindrodendrum hubeiense TaxID=595255 RepID=A0A9P5H1G1_9HYPO|nr:hypothetical protein G7Z17_g10827 [Cylindrodendrum hubeiense]